MLKHKLIEYMSNQRKRKAASEPKRFAVVLVDFVGFNSFIDSFDTETELRKYLVSDVLSRYNSNVEVGQYERMELNELVKEARECTVERSASGECAQIVAVVQDGEFLIYEHVRK